MTTHCSQRRVWLQNAASIIHTKRRNSARSGQVRNKLFNLSARRAARSARVRNLLESERNGLMASTRGKVARFITISISCIGLAVSTLACSKLPAENSNRGNERTQAEAAIRQQEDGQIKAI